MYSIFKSFLTNKPTHAAIIDLIEGYQRRNLWFALALKDTRLRYKRTLLGPFWQTLSLAIFISTLGILYSKFWNMEIKEFLPFLSVGMTTWMYITTVTNEGCNVFVSSEAFIKQRRIPYSIFVYQLLMRNIIVYLHNLPIVLIVLTIFQFHISWTTFLIIPGFVILTLNLFWISMLLGIICVRFRDVSTLVGSLTQIAFFITPIFWVPQLAGNQRSVIVDSNPIYHLIELLRGPMLGYAPANLSWIVTIGSAVVGLSLTFVFFSRFRSRIPYWL